MIITTTLRDGWRRHLVVAGLAGAIWLGGGGTRAPEAPAADADDGNRPAAAPGIAPARRAVTPIAPDLAGEVVVALQGGAYDDAIRGIDPLIADARTLASDRSFYRLVRGLAARLANRPDEARATWLAAIEAEPAGPWANKIRGELAGLELATGHPDRAEALARAEAETLLAPDRKDRLAGVYREFARRLLEPPFPGTPADPAGAYALLAKARELARGPSLRAEILFAMARAAQAAQAPVSALKAPTGGMQTVRTPVERADPVRDYTAYLREYPRGTDRDAARFHLGEVQLATGQPVEARTTWTDLARDLGNTPGVDRDAPRQALRGRTLLGIAGTYGMPTPPDAASLNLGVAALRRLLKEVPADPHAPAAAFEIGQAYLHQGQADPGIAAFQSFLTGEGYRVDGAEARRSRAELTSRATFLIARAMLGQKKFAEAIAAFEGYLRQFPDGPESVDARRAILDAQYTAAGDALERERYAEARGRFLRFAEANPLDGRVPAALFEAARTFAREQQWAEAVAAWDALAARFPAAVEAAQAQYQAASLVEVEQGNPAAAIDRFRKLTAVPAFAADARQRIAVMEAKALTVVTPRAFRSGETAHLKVSTRNLERLTFSAYKLNPEAYFRKKQTLDGVATLDIGLVAPDVEWTAPVPSYGQYKPLEADFDLKVALPGVYVVKVSDEKTLQASALVIGSDLEAIVKVSRDQILAFAQDMKTGRGRPGARLIVADGARVVFEATTGADGVAQGSWTPGRPAATAAPAAQPPRAEPVPDPGRSSSEETVNAKRDNGPDTASLRYLVLDGADTAGSGLVVPGRVAQGLSARAYIDTDRPAYRPGQEVLIRGVIREIKDGQYDNPAGRAYKLEVADSQGRRLVTREVKLSPFGTFAESIRLADGAPVGSYRIRAWRPGGSDFAGDFEVQAYQLEKLGLELDLPRTVFYRGEIIKGTLQARYGYDAPAAGRPIAVRLPDGRTLRGATDAKGQFAIEFATDSFGEDQALPLRADLTADNVSVRATVRIATAGFAIGLATGREVYLDGETFTLEATTRDALGQPTGQDLRVAVIRPVRRANEVVEREISSRTFRTDKGTGKGQVNLNVEEAGRSEIILRVAGTDQFGHPIVADHRVTISGRGDADKLRIIADRTAYKVGEAATVRLVNRGQAGTALVAWEADRILRYRLIPLQAGENRLDWQVDGPEFPNFTLTASRLDAQRFDEARVDLKVERDLRITLKPKVERVAPGAEIEVEITAEDQLGRPAQAGIALALVDRTLLRRFGDKLPPIGPFFYDQTRLGSFATASTNTFSDHPATVPVPDAVVEEAERQLALGRDEIARRQVLEKDKAFKLFDMAREDKAMILFNDVQRAPARSPASLAAPSEKMEGELSELEPAGRRARAKAGRSFFRSDMAAGVDQDDSPDRSFAAMDDATSDSYGGDIVSRSAPINAAINSIFQYSFTARSVGRINVPVPRREFVETAYWNPAVVTGADGRATVKFAAPEALSEYRLLAKGITGADTLAGQASVTIAVRKDFYVELRAPARLTEGDKPRFVARVHHVGVAAGTVVQVKLASYAAEQDRVDPKTVEVAGDGVAEVIFDPIEIPDAESIRLTVSARAGDQVDEVVAEVPIRPWGVQAIATASGTASSDATAIVALPAGRRYDDLAMQVRLAPSLDRLVVQLATARDDFTCLGDPIGRRWAAPVVVDATADRAADLLAAVAALDYLRDVRDAEPGVATQLRDRARGLVAELVTTQNPDGGWPWVRPTARNKVPSDPQVAAAAAWALQEAKEAGIGTDAGVIDKARDYLAGELGRTAADPDARAAVLHALGMLGRANFEAVNALNRGRQGLSSAALAYLALSFGRLDRAGLGGEVLDLLASRAVAEPVGVGEPQQLWWDGGDHGVRHRGAADSTALATLAFARVRPASPQAAAGVAWLLAHRAGPGWTPHRAQGPAVAAIAALKGRAGATTDRYRLVVSVNDIEVARVEVVGATASQVISVPRKVLKGSGPNAVRCRIEGRGTYHYVATLTGFARDFAPEQRAEGKAITVEACAYLPAAPELDGKELPVGFDAVVNPTKFVNKASEVERGGRVEVAVDFKREDRPGAGNPERDYLIVEETLPAGTTLVEGSIRSTASSYTLGDGTIAFAFAPDGPTPQIRYELAGYLPGTYRALPTVIRGVTRPGVLHLGPVGVLRVLAPGEPATDPYRATPDELLARGRALAAGGRLVEASVPLEALLGGYTPQDDVARDAARILLAADIRRYDARKVVRDFEILKDKGPGEVIPFDEILVVGRAYRDIGEPERAFLVFRALAEASYLEDAQVGEALRRDGRTLEGIAALLDLWREAPGSAAIEGDLFGLAQVLADVANRAGDDPKLRAELARSDVARPELLAQAIRLIRTSLALGPKSPLADEMSLAWLGDELELEDFAAVTRLAPRFAGLYPTSSFLDSFLYADALGRFQLGEYDRAVAIAAKIAAATYPDATGVPRPSPNKWQALYILGQIYDARRQPARAVEFYRQVADRFGDAADAVLALDRRSLKLPEVTILRPAAAPPAGGAVALDPAPAPPTGGVVLDYRNVGEVDVKVYPVDLMRLYLTRRNLDSIAGIDLAGITPLHEARIKLGDPMTYADASRTLDLPVTREGAYLVLVRGGDLDASGIVLVSPLRMEVTEEPEAGRVRVVVRDAGSGDFVPRAQVKVIGSNNPTFTDGRTDLRGVVVADGIRGQVTAVARVGAGRYAFHRGTQLVGGPATPGLGVQFRDTNRGRDQGQAADPTKSRATLGAGETLDQNLRSLNSQNQARGIDRLQNRFNEQPAGVKAQEAK